MKEAPLMQEFVAVLIVLSCSKSKPVLECCALRSVELYRPICVAITLCQFSLTKISIFDLEPVLSVNIVHLEMYARQCLVMY